MERAIKYGALFLVLVFTAFFLFEVLSALKIHPFQYTLVASLTGDCLGYFPTRESYVRGGYEPWVAKAFSARLLAEGVDDVIVKESVRLLLDLQRQMTPPIAES